MFVVWVLCNVCMTDGSEDVGSKFLKRGDIIVGNAWMETFNEETDVFGVVVQVREAEDDAGKEWDGGNVLLVGRLVGGDE